MIVRIAGKKYKVPENTDDISFGHFVSINSYISGKTEVNLEDKRMILSLLMKCDVDVLDEVMDEDIDGLYSLVPYLIGRVPVKHMSGFILDGKKYGFVDFDNLTVKQYADIMFYLSDGKDIYENLDKCLGSCVRVSSENKSVWDILRYKRKGFYILQNDIKADADDDSDYSDIVYENFTATIVIFLIDKIQNMKRNLVERYPSVFINKEDEEDEEDEKNEGTKLRRTLSVAEIWGMYHTVHALVDNDKQRADYWYTRPIGEFFTFLSYHKQLSIENQKNNR